MTSAEAKREAEEELKRINNQFEKLKKHFESDHKSGSGCRCQPAAAGPPPPNSQSSAGSRSTSNNSSSPSEDQKRREEEATRKRNADREKKAAEEAAAKRAAEAARNAQEKEESAEDTLKGEALRRDEALRWKCTMAAGAAFILLIAYCWIGCAARDLVHTIGKQWDEFRQQFKPKDPPLQDPPSYTHDFPEYIPPYERPPTGNITSWRQYFEDITGQQEIEERKYRENPQQNSDWPFAPPAPPPGS